MKLKKLRKVLEYDQYVELLDPDPMGNVFGGAYEGIIGELDKEHYDNCEVVAILPVSNLIHIEDDNDMILRTVIKIYIERGNVI